jgi:hypothetical protein
LESVLFESGDGDVFGMEVDLMGKVEMLKTHLCHRRMKEEVAVSIGEERMLWLVLTKISDGHCKGSLMSIILVRDKRGEVNMSTNM